MVTPCDRCDDYRISFSSPSLPFPLSVNNLLRRLSIEQFQPAKLMLVPMSIAIDSFPFLFLFPPHHRGPAGAMSE